MRLPKSSRLVITIGLLALLLRLPGLGSFMTPDEENWLLRSGYFWHKLVREHDPTGTFLTTHPGVLTMWLAGSGIVWQEQQLGYDIDTSNIRDFRNFALWPVLLVISGLIGVVAALVGKLWQPSVGWVAGIMLAAEPYFVGMSQIVHVDALLALCMLIAFLLFLLYFQASNRKYLIWGAIFAGLAAANKFLPALWLLPSFGVLALWGSSGSVWQRFYKGTQLTIVVMAIATITVFAVWPATWSYADTLRYFNKDIQGVVADNHVELNESTEPILPATFYPRMLLSRTSLPVLIMALGAAVVAGQVLLKTNRSNETVTLRKQAMNILILWLFAVGFLLLITYVPKKGDRYGLPSLISLCVLASWGIVLAWQVAQQRIKWLQKKNTTYAVVIALFLALLAQPLLWSPYTIAYENPIFDIRSLTQQGWGEGIDEAAAWLNQHPLAEELHVASWYPSIFGAYFTGKTFSLSSRDDARTAFVVLYRNMYGRSINDEATDILRDFADKEPVHTVFIQGKPYAWIYNTMGLAYFTQHTGELLAGMEVGQTVSVDQDNWNQISIGLSTFSGRSNTEDVLLHIREDVNTSEDLRTVRIDARTIEDQAYQNFTFEPIADSKGKTYYVALTSPTSSAGNAITVRFSDTDLLPGEFYLRRRALKEGERPEQFVRAGDLAYRLP